MAQTHVTTVTWAKADTLRHPEKRRTTSYTDSYSIPTGATGGSDTARLSANHSHMGREGDQVGLGRVHHLQTPFQVHHSDLFHHQGALSILPSAQIQVGIRKPTAGIGFCTREHVFLFIF